MGNLVVGRKLDTLLPEVMSLFAQVGPSEKATSKAFLSATRVQEIFEKARKGTSTGQKSTGDVKKGQNVGQTLNALKEALNHSMADMGEAVKHLSQHGISLESFQVQEQFRSAPLHPFDGNLLCGSRLVY